MDTSDATTARLALADGELPDWARECDRFDSNDRSVAAHRIWRGIAEE